MSILIWRPYAKEPMDGLSTIDSDRESERVASEHPHRHPSRPLFTDEDVEAAEAELDDAGDEHEMRQRAPRFQDDFGI